MDFSWVSRPDAWVALLTLTVLEIVLGIDNIIFISILSNKLPPEQRKKAQQVGLLIALVTRVALLLSISWVMSLKAELFNIAGKGFSGRDLILGLGGLFLIWKATHEIHHKLEGHAEGQRKTKGNTFTAIVLQIVVLDIIFSLDSVITAVGMAKDLTVMILAVVIAIGFMLAFATKVADFVERHPTVKMLALAFLVLIGVNLLAEAMGQHIEKAYTYFAMAFAASVEMLNLRLKKQGEAVHLHASPIKPAE